MARKRKSIRKKLLQWLFYCLVGFLIITIIPVISLKWAQPPLSSFMLQDKLVHNTKINYQWIARQQISKHFAIAAVAAEDQKFPNHFGFDFGAIRTALEDKSRGKSLRGASTITQQVAKNLFLWDGRTLFRKGLEAYFTLLIELIWDKPRILEVYLNIAEMGDGIYGVQAASRYYFNKNAWEVSLREACLLVAILPSPKRYQLKPPSNYVSDRAREIQMQIQQLGGFDFYMNK